MYNGIGGLGLNRDGRHRGKHVVAVVGLSHAAKNNGVAGASHRVTRSRRPDLSRPVSSFEVP